MDEIGAPVEIGTKGSIGSLIMREIEYFGRVQSSCGNHPHKTGPGMDSSDGIQPRAAFGLLLHQRKKKRGGSGLLPSICSMIEVSDNRLPIRSSSFNYRSLKHETKLQV
ncbi:hypothetical protein MLD38_022062 [Melastoma candidum]|uniref:Uncharacterized protein n=1 Tax=Melastoma candidum TaxID=119954 RepID=A0ACB9QR48_9MYRT|nr:hypothetical protein MLD38_022062 [Melastoma candidum]